MSVAVAYIFYVSQQPTNAVLGKLSLEEVTPSH